MKQYLEGVHASSKLAELEGEEASGRHNEEEAALRVRELADSLSKRQYKYVRV